MATDYREGQPANLAALGQVLGRDFQALLRQFAIGWFAQENLLRESLQEFSSLEVEIEAIMGLYAEFWALECQLTSGFLPTDWSEPAASSSLQETTALKSQLSVPSPRTRGLSPLPPERQEGTSFSRKATGKETALGSTEFPEARQEGAKAEEQGLGRDFQALPRQFATGWFAQEDLLRESLQGFSSLAAEIEPVLQVRDQFLAIEESLTSGFLPKDWANRGNFPLPETTALKSQLSVPSPRTRGLSPLPPERQEGTSFSRKATGKETALGSTEFPEARQEGAKADYLSTPWQAKTIKGLPDLAQRLAGEQLGEELRENGDSPQGQSQLPTSPLPLSPLPTPPTPHSLSFPSLADSIRAAALTGQFPKDPGEEWEESQTQNQLEESWERQQTWNPKEHLERQEVDGHWSEEDLAEILEAIARQIQQEYRQFYGG